MRPISCGDRHRRPGRLRRPPALPGSPRARQRARPDLARPVRGGRPDRDRRRRAGRLHRRPLELEAPGDGDDRSIERVDPSWISAVAMIPDSDLDGIAGRWIELVEDELGASAARGEALDPRPGRAHRGLLPRGRPRPRRPVRLVASVTDETGTTPRRSPPTRSSGTPGPPSTPAAASTISRGSRRAASGSGRTRSS